MAKVKASYFDRAYWMDGTKSGYSPQKGYFRESYMYGAVAQFLTSFLGKEGKWLEAGCAFGWVCEKLIEEGIDVYGFDISKYSVKHSPPEISNRLKVSDGLNPKLYPENQFDVIYSMEVAEHVHIDDIDTWLSNLYYWLKLDGILFITICLGHDNLRGADDIDQSHQTLQPREWWLDKMRSVGFVVDEELYQLSKTVQVKTSDMINPEYIAKKYNWHIFVLKRLLVKR